MRNYTVYIKPADPYPMETAEFIDEGLSLWAMIFQLFWALYHRAYRFALVIFAINGAILALDYTLIIGPTALLIINIATVLYIGLSAKDWRAQALINRGYILSKIVIAENKTKAQLRFYDYYVEHAKQLTRAGQ